jgi:hypothetical protein
MKKFILRGALCLVVLLPAMNAAARTVTQGQFALALAQVLGIEVTGIEQAVTALNGMKIAPVQGWVPESVITTQVAWELEAAVKRAVAAGLLKPIVADGAVQTAAASLDMDISPESQEGERVIGVPPAPIAGQPNDPVFLEGPGEASPFRP